MNKTKGEPSDAGKGKKSAKRGFFAAFFVGAWHLLCKACQGYARLYRGRAWWVKLLIAFLSLVVLICLFILAVIFNFLWLFGKSPSAKEIMHPKTEEASLIYSADGKTLGKFFNQNRQSVSFDSISNNFFQALISTEDERFYSHNGVDFAGTASAVKDAARGRARGASTITQQLVKNMFNIRNSKKYGTGPVGKLPGMRIVIMKTKEIAIALQLEMFNEKDSILRMYANTVDFGSNAYGIRTAAKTYFGKSPSQLKVEESAVLVGLLKATSTYNPRINPERSLQRRNVVLDNLYAHRKEMAERFGHAAINTKFELDSLKALPIQLNFSVESAYDGTALYFRQAVADEIETLSKYDRINTSYDADGVIDPYTDGLKIFTTLDSRMQRYAEEAVREQMKNVQQSFDNHWRGMGDPWRDAKGNIIPGFIEKIATTTDSYKRLAARFPDAPDSVNYYLNKPHDVKLFDYDGGHTEFISTMDSIRYMVHFMHAGFVAMEPSTGHVKAYVGDIDFKTWKYDKVKAMRQPGSTFKLFVYATAMKQGWTPSDARLTDSYIRMEVRGKTPDRKRDTTTIWQPHNANGHFSNANIPLSSAFAQSVNTIAVKLGQEVGIDNVIRTAEDMGIESTLENIPSLPLGSSDVNLFELVNAYSTVANQGKHVEPTLITKIVDREGHVIYEANPKETTALDATAAFYMQKLLEAGVRMGGGTSQTLGASMYLGGFNGKLDFGGKTGTSNNHSDAWFVGVTPALVGGAWVGGEYRSIHFRTGKLGQGSRTALPIFGLFMKKVLDDPELQARYLQLYPPPPAGIDESTYKGGYYAVPAAASDSLDDEFLDEGLIGEDGLPITGGDVNGGAGSGDAEEREAMPRQAENSADELFD